MDFWFWCATPRFSVAPSDRLYKKSLSHLCCLSHENSFSITWSSHDSSFQFPWIQFCDPTTPFFFLPPCALRWMPILQWLHRGKKHCQYGIHNCCYFPQDLESHIWNYPPGTNLDDRPIQTAGNSHLTVTLLLLTDFKKGKGERDDKEGESGWCI